MNILLLRPQIKYAPGLPIVERKNDIIEALQKNQVIIVAGETGSGKTTQLPVICLEAGRGVLGKIGCTQPRRIAAISISEHLARQLESTPGQEVGYKIRFNDMESPGTCIKFMTDGILLAEMRNSPDLKMYDTLIIDEAHERSLNIDFILGYLRKLLPRRPDLKVIISSATIDTTLFSKTFGDAPVISVSGRVFPVEVFYRDFRNDDAEELGYVDETIEAVKDLYTLEDNGDILIFLPTERDIRETCNRLVGLKLHNTTILPLFSRLSRHEQSLIFNPLDGRKIVVATNIAETSITVPGIRFVVDSGLARIAEYAPRLRTNRLPISPVSRASADQRKGRCGRVMDGICIRLYTMDDYNGRDQFTLPEIKRSNLAGVILTMIAYHLGEIESFPFLEPPSKQAIAEGYAQLRELGAIDKSNKLTALGKQISRFPLDPHVARMIIAARDENALREVKIIAAALSIVDPRERPFEKRAEADAMHKRFLVPGSDPLSFVRLWDAYQDEWRTLGTQNKMRRFCKDHFLSYTRMQEWHDVHQLISEELERMKGFFENSTPATPDAVHRALLSGLIVNCAMKNEKGKFRAARGREVIIFPGSTLSGQAPDWITCHEIVETSQCFARGVFPIKPVWLEQIAAHLCTRSYSDPHFDKGTGFVRATERVTLSGLPVTVHNGVHFGKIDPVKSTEIFIRQALVEEQLDSSAPFYQHNRALRQEIEKTEMKLRSRSYFAGENAIYDFYASRLTCVTSSRDLKMLIGEKGSDQFLFMTEDDLCAQPLPESVKQFPDVVSVGGKQVPLKYAFDPGASHDGVTIKLSENDLSNVSSRSVGWILPALWPQKITELLRNCPKDIRKKFMPVEQTALKIASSMTVTFDSFNDALSKIVAEQYGVSIDFSEIARKSSVPHLDIKLQLHNEKGEIVQTGNAEEILSKIADGNKDGDSGWQELCQKYQQYGLTSWDCNDIPEHIQLTSSKGGVPLFGYPALICSADENSVDLRVLRTIEEASEKHPVGVSKLLDTALCAEFAWLDKELRMTQNSKLLCTPFGGSEKIRTVLFDIVKRYLLELDDSPVRTRLAFDCLVQNKKKIARGLGYEVANLLETSLSLYADNCKSMKTVSVKYKDTFSKELKAYIDNLLMGKISFECFRQYPRYLKAFHYRIARLNLDPVKFREKFEMLHLYQAKFTELVAKKDQGKISSGKINSLRIMIEEFAISLFAQQEIKTIFPVSTKRLDKEFADLV